MDNKKENNKENLGKNWKNNWRDLRIGFISGLLVYILTSLPHCIDIMLNLSPKINNLIDITYFIGIVILTWLICKKEKL